MNIKEKLNDAIDKYVPEWVKKLVSDPFWSGTIGKMTIAVVSGAFLSGGFFLFYLICCPNENCDSMLCKLVWKHSPWFLFTGLAAAPSMLLTWFWRRQQNVERLITERFAKAIEQLGSKELAVRLGAIYQLERIAQDSKRDHWTVVETLSAFIRENSWKKEEKTGESQKETPEQEAKRTPPATDIQAALTVLGRRKWRDTEQNQVDLSKAKLQGANLRNAHLEGANFYFAHLEGAHLYSAHLEEANLSAAHLERASLSAAHLEKAHLNSAHLEKAHLNSAHLEKAYLDNAHFEEAVLMDVHLEEAFLNSAHLAGANLVLAHLEGASLSSAQLERATLLDAHLEKANLIAANLKMVDLRNANLEQVILINTNLSGAIIDARTSFKEALYSNETKFPKGFDPKKRNMKLMVLDKQSGKWHPASPDKE